MELYDELAKKLEKVDPYFKKLIKPYSEDANWYAKPTFPAFSLSIFIGKDNYFNPDLWTLISEDDIYSVAWLDKEEQDYNQGFFVYTEEDALGYCTGRIVPGFNDEAIEIIKEFLNKM